MAAVDPTVVIGDAAFRGIVAGAREMARLLAPTLGPTPRTVIVGPIASTGKPEVLDHAATIARRVYALGDRIGNIGASLVRHVAWQTYEQAGDGSATAAVIAARLLAEAERLIAAGVQPKAIAAEYRRSLERALAALAGMASPIGDKSELARFLAGNLPEPGLAETVAEIAFSLDEDGAVLVEESSTTETVHEYVDGMRWDKGWLPAFAETTSATRRLDDPRILVTTQAVDTAEQVSAIIVAAGQAGPANLLLVAPSVSETAAAYLNVNRNGPKLKNVGVAGLEGMGLIRDQIAVDIAVGTGGRCIVADSGERIENVRPGDFGHARLAWVRRNQSAVLGGRGSRPRIRARLAEARAELRAAGEDAATKASLRKRIGRLSGATAVIMVGGRTDGERASLRTRVQAAVTTAPEARKGVVAGCGAALVRAAAAVTAGTEAGSAEGFCSRSFARALSEPMKLIAANAGGDPTILMEEAIRRLGQAFDVVAGVWQPTSSGGVADALGVVSTALRIAVGAAATAVGTAAVVRGRRPRHSVDP